MRLDDLFRNKLHDAASDVPEDVWDRLEAGLNEALPQSDGASACSEGALAGSAKIGAAVAKALAAIALAALAAGGIYWLSRDASEADLPKPKAEPAVSEPEQVQAETAGKISVSGAENRIADSFYPNADSFSSNGDSFSSNGVSENEVERKAEEKQETASSVAQTSASVAAEPVQQESGTAAKIVEESPRSKTVRQSGLGNNEVEAVERPEATFEPAIGIPNLVTPNNDGINDRFEIRNIEQYPDNELVIFDRRGKVVFRAMSYANDWAAEGLADGAYFYRFAVRKEAKQKIFTGNITVMR